MVDKTGVGSCSVPRFSDFNFNPPPAMQINFEKAHKLITRLEEALQATTSHTSQAREVLDEWRKKGEAGLRKKTAQALKLVRKKADSFAEALTHLEDNLAKSLDRISDSLEKTDDKPRPAGRKKAAKKASPRRAARTKPAEPAAP